MAEEGSNIKIYGYYSTNDEWLPVQVDVNGALVVTT